MNAMTKVELPRWFSKSNSRAFKHADFRNNIIGIMRTLYILELVSMEDILALRTVNVAMLAERVSYSIN